MVALRAKIDTAVNWANSCRMANVVMIEKMPTANGKSAATIEPNTHTRSTRVIGMAIISAVSRSSSMVWVTSALTTASPPARTVAALPRRPPLDRLDQLVGPFDRLRLGAFDVGHDEGVVSVGATQRGWIPQRPIRHGEIDVFEAGDEPGDLHPGRRVRWLSTSPSSAVTTRTTFGWTWPNDSSRTSSASTDSAPAGSNPPAIRLRATPPPNTAAATVSNRTPSRVVPRRRTMNEPSRASMADFLPTCVLHREHR